MKNESRNVIKSGIISSNGNHNNQKVTLRKIISEWRENCVDGNQWNLIAVLVSVFSLTENFMIGRHMFA